MIKMKLELGISELDPFFNKDSSAYSSIICPVYINHLWYGSTILCMPVPKQDLDF
jgi:hypothetical protein